jgi:hypothetical protein
MGISFSIDLNDKKDNKGNNNENNSNMWRDMNYVKKWDPNTNDLWNRDMIWVKKSSPKDGKVLVKKSSSKNGTNDVWVKKSVPKNLVKKWNSETNDAFNKDLEWVTKSSMKNNKKVSAKKK